MSVAESKPQIITHVQKSLTFTIYDTLWVPRSCRFAVLGMYPRGTGAIRIYELDRGKLKDSLEFEHKSAIRCGTFGASPLEERHLATGDFDGGLATWDLEHMGKPVYAAAAHSGIINAIDGCGGIAGEGAPEIATGSRDGCVRIWDTRQADDPVASFEPARGAGVDCWGVAFGHAYNDMDRTVAAGYDNGDVKLFDLRTNTVRWETNVRNGVCSIQFDRKDIDMNKLLVCTLESKYRVYDMRTFHKSSGYTSVSRKANDSTVWCGRHLPQNRDVFMSCHGNGTLELARYSYPAKRCEPDANGDMQGVPGTVQVLADSVVSTQPINSFDWSIDKKGLCVFGAFDQTVRVGIVTKLNTIS